MMSLCTLDVQLKNFQKKFWMGSFGGATVEENNVTLNDCRCATKSPVNVNKNMSTSSNSHKSLTSVKIPQLYYKVAVVK